MPAGPCILTVTGRSGASGAVVPIHPSQQPHLHGRSHQPGRLAGGLLGSACGYVLASRLPTLPSTLLTSLALAGGAALCGRSLLPPPALWALIGAAAGSLLGTSTVLAQKLQEVGLQAHIGQRAITVLLPALAGVIAGLSLSRDAASSHRRHPRDLLRSASALTTGIFAVLVTLTFVHLGLDAARTFSSRLSTSLTILVTSVVVPGWFAHLLLASRPLANARRLDGTR